MFSLYLAHSITGLTGKDVLDYYKTMKMKLNGKFDVLSPMSGKEYLRTDKKIKAADHTNPVSTNHAIFERDMWMVSQADIVLVDLSNVLVGVSIGCVMELAVASYLRKHTIVVISKDNECLNHAFVFEAADILFNNLDSALDYLDDLSNEVDCGY